MKTITIAILALLSLSIASAQVNRSDPNKVLPITDKLGEIDAANQILPLLLTKQQIRDLMPAIEKCRLNVRNQEKKEADRLKEMVPEIEKMHADAVKGLLPKEEFLKKVNELFRRFENERTGVKIANQIILGESVDKVFNEGQKKAAVGVVDKIFNEQKRTWEDGTPQAKLHYFMTAVLLGDHGYNFLTKLLAAK